MLSVMDFRDIDKYSEYARAVENAQSLREVFEIEGTRFATEEEICSEMGIAFHGKVLTDYMEENGIPPGEFSLHLISRVLSGDCSGTGITCDGDYKFSLVRKGLERYKDVACMGFNDLTAEEGTLAIKQLQGPHKHGDMITYRYPDAKKNLPRQWERKMVKIALNWAKDAGFKKATMPTAASTPYYVMPYGMDRGEEVYDHQNRLKVRYDVTAKRLGFTFDGRNYGGEYFMTL
ncbi:MAG: hypothetical protein V1648_04940 [Candidatus Aenigmatarchaeota archaeon]